MQKDLETSLKRLEEILAKMQEGKLPLEESLKLYQEANQLVGNCTQTLMDAEKKIEVLMKDREGNLKMKADGKPQSQSFE